MSTAVVFRSEANRMNKIDIYASQITSMAKEAVKEGKYFIDVDFAQFEMPPHVVGSLEKVSRDMGFIVSSLGIAYASVEGVKYTEGYVMRINW